MTNEERARKWLKKNGLAARGYAVHAHDCASLAALLDEAEARGRESVPARIGGVPLGDLREYDGTE